MNRPPRQHARAGGALLAAAVLTGVVVGAFYHEPSLGFLGGLAAGLLLLAAVWLLDRRRSS
ncbi:MAG: hypothetical protein ACXWUP_02490 [Allosphingosinicella sp.]